MCSLTFGILSTFEILYFSMFMLITLCAACNNMLVCVLVYFQCGIATSINDLSTSSTFPLKKYETLDTILLIQSSLLKILKPIISE